MLFKKSFFISVYFFSYPQNSWPAPVFISPVCKKYSPSGIISGALSLLWWYKIRSVHTISESNIPSGDNVLPASSSFSKAYKLIIFSDVNPPFSQNVSSIVKSSFSRFENAGISCIFLSLFKFPCFCISK